MSSLVTVCIWYSTHIPPLSWHGVLRVIRHYDAVSNPSWALGEAVAADIAFTLLFEISYTSFKLSSKEIRFYLPLENEFFGKIKGSCGLCP